MIPQPCNLTDPLCCDFLFDVANTILMSGMSALAGCMETADCEGMESYVSHAEPVGATSDYLAVWLVDSAFIYDRSGRFPRVQPTYSIRLVEGGFPMPVVASSPMTLPPRDDLHAAAGASYSHAEALVRRMLNLKRDLFGCENVNVMRMVPQPVAYGFGGWTITIRFDMPLGPASSGS